MMFLWRATRGYRLQPWKSPYIRWRIETFSGIHAESIDAKQFFSFTWRKRKDLSRFLRWASAIRG